MKKNIFFTVFISLSLVFASCGSSNTSDYEDDDNNNVETTDFDNDNNYYDDENVNEYNDDDEIIDDEYIFTGTYDSKTGVMVDISCYCYQVGYFHAENGEEFAICFPNKMEEANCSEKLEIEGYFESVKINPESTSPCQAGEQELFYVTDYRCL